MKQNFFYCKNMIEESLTKYIYFFGQLTTVSFIILKLNLLYSGELARDWVSSILRLRSHLLIIEIMFLVIHLSFVHHVDTKLVLRALHCNIRFCLYLCCFYSQKASQHWIKWPSKTKSVHFWILKSWFRGIAKFLVCL